MTDENPYAILFEPVQIGPVTSKNRFYMTPHATGMGYSYPERNVRYRGVKAEGGWGVICTEETMISETSDHMPSPYMRLFSDADIPLLAKTADAVHEHGALLGVELSHAGKSAANRLSRQHSIGPSQLHYSGIGPYVTRRADLADIKSVIEWQRAAARRAKSAGADIVYVYCAHDLSLPMQFLLKRYNDRGDAYGGSLENRVRLLREMLEATKDEVGETCAVAIRFAVDELMGADGLEWHGEGREVIEMLAELPDLWDVNVSDWSNDSGTARFFEEDHQREVTDFVKTVTSKPVVGVGRYTSPDRMVSDIRKKRLDFIGAARPGIADPFLPAKIESGKIDTIRECIGCNMCTTNVLLSVPIRCTQNPTVGMEADPGWHPEIVPAKTTDAPVLVVGSGPAGLECALTLAQRGTGVTIAEATDRFGGRSIAEAGLPGLSTWSRVAEYRIGQLQQMANVKMFLHSAINAEIATELGIRDIVLATGGIWRRDGKGRQNLSAIPGHDQAHVHTPDDVMAGLKLSGRVIVFDDEHYYMGSVIAEKLARDGCDVTLITPLAEIGAWSKFTLEYGHIQKRMAALDVTILPFHNIAEVTEAGVVARHVFTGQIKQLDADGCVMVTMKQPNDTLYRQLAGTCETDGRSAAPFNISRIGDCMSPGPIAQAVHDGHRWGRAFGDSNADR